jgi:hypothetical protein
MAKLSDEMIESIKSACDKIQYGKVTICMNETSPNVDIVVEERRQFKKEVKAGMPARPQFRREG